MGSSSALAELFLIILMTFLVMIPAIALIIKLNSGSKVSFKNVLVFIVLSLPALFAYKVGFYDKQQSCNDIFTGSNYVLSEYPDCSYCVLELNDNEKYAIKEQGEIIEEGVWEADCAGDAFIVTIGDKGRLGLGKYVYKSYFN